MASKPLFSQSLFMAYILVCFNKIKIDFNPKKMENKAQRRVKHEKAVKIMKISAICRFLIREKRGIAIQSEAIQQMVNKWKLEKLNRWNTLIKNKI